MKLEELQKNWEEFSRSDPLWGILTWPDKKGGRWNIVEFFETGVQEVAEVLAKVEALGLPLRRGRALDFGCGVGRLSQALARQFAEVDGVDISPTMIDLANRYNQAGDACRYHLNPRDDLSLFGDDVFDFVYSAITLQHMQPRYSRAYLREFMRVLAPGGVLVFQAPGEPKTAWKKYIQPLKSLRLFRVYQRLRYGQQPIMEMYCLPRPEVIDLIEAAGGRMAAVEPDDMADVHWHSYRYFIVKG